MNLTYTLTDETQGKRIIYSCPCFPSSMILKPFILLLIALLLPQYFALLYPAASRGEINHTNIQLFPQGQAKSLHLFSFFLFISRGSPLFTSKDLGAFLTSPVVLSILLTTGNGKKLGLAICLSVCTGVIL